VLSHNRHERTTGQATFICPVCDRESVVGIPDQSCLFRRCPTCHPDLPLVDGILVDGDYPIEIRA
jgi:hypothetical protein